MREQSPRFPISADQDLTVQREALRKAGVQVIFEEKASGTKRDNREELAKALHILGERDTLVVTRLDRLARPSHTRGQK
jgi:DNA invertase Pin-like site-specific DNA recombinase